MAEQLCLVFIPALVVILQTAETKKGAPLTEREVMELRDHGACIAVTPDAALNLERERGYPDIVAEDCWKEWQRWREPAAN